MRSFLDRYVEAERAMWKPPAPLEQWYGNNKFWAWAINMAVSFIAVMIALLALLIDSREPAASSVLKVAPRAADSPVTKPLDSAAGRPR